MRNIAVALEKMPVLPPTPETRHEDCKKIRDVLDSVGIELRLGEVYAFWEAWSRRQGVEWAVPENEIALTIEVGTLAIASRK